MFLLACQHSDHLYCKVHSLLRWAWSAALSMHIWYAGCLSRAYNGSHGPDLLQDLLQDWLCPPYAWGLHRPLPLLPALQGPPDCLGRQGLVQGPHSSCSSCACPVDAHAGECKPSLLSVRLGSMPMLHSAIQLLMSMTQL